MNALQRLARMKLTADQLARPYIVQRIFETLSTDPGKVIPPNERGQLEVFAAAEHALDAARRAKNPARNPFGIFVAVLTERVCDTITNAQEMRAQEKIRELKRSGNVPGPFAEVVIKSIFK